MSGFDLIGPDGMAGAGTPPLIGEVSHGGEGDGAQQGPAFANALGDVLESVAALQDDVKAKAEGMAMGKPVEVSDLMISVGKSEVAFNLMLEVRNKMVEAWERLSRSVV